MSTEYVYSKGFSKDFYLRVHVCLHTCAYMQLLTEVKEGIRSGEL